MATFPHHKLEAYRLALQLVVDARNIADRIPRGHKTLADQLVRATQSGTLLVAEGANRVHPMDKRNRYAMARGEIGEAAAACEIAQVIGVIDPATTQRFLERASHVCAILTNLCKRMGTLPVDPSWNASPDEPGPRPEPEPEPEPSATVSSSDPNTPSTPDG